MAPRTKSKKHPVASRKKRIMHAFYLAQPFIQFVALMAVLFTLGRCSPLSPSQDRTLNKVSSDGVRNTRSESGNSISEDIDIKSSLKDLNSTDEMTVISQSDFAKLSATAIDTLKPADLARVKGVFAQRLRARGSVRLLVVNLTAQQKEEMAQKGGLVKPLDVAQLLSQNALPQPEIRRSYIGALHNTPRVEGKAYLVLSDDAMRAPDAVTSLPIGHKFALGIFPSEEKAYISATRVEQRLDDEQQELIKSNLEKSIFMAIVLE